MEKGILFQIFIRLFFLLQESFDYYLNQIQEKFELQHSKLRMAIIPAFKAEILIRKSLKNEHLNGAIDKLVSSKQISECDFLVLPLVRDQHWFMAIIKNINKSFQHDYSASITDISTDEFPVVIYFDSFQTYFGPEDRRDFDGMIFAFLRDCLVAHKQISNFLFFQNP